MKATYIAIFATMWGSLSTVLRQFQEVDDGQRLLVLIWQVLLKMQIRIEMVWGMTITIPGRCILD